MTPATATCPPLPKCDHCGKERACGRFRMTRKGSTPVRFGFLCRACRAIYERWSV